MKNTIALFVCALAVLTAISCGDHSSNSSSSDFKIKPGDVATITPNLTGKGTSFDVTFGSNQYSDTTNAYAIIISNVNNTNNVGIAFGTDPKSNRSFKVFIYYKGDLTLGSKLGTVTVIENGVKSTGNISFDLSGPSNDCYTIDIPSSNNILSGTIKAYLAQ
jgi:hypothetical protein